MGGQPTIMDCKLFHDRRFVEWLSPFPAVEYDPVGQIMFRLYVDTEAIEQIQ